MINSNLLNQFRSFCFRNYPADMETQIEYFSVFGGFGWDVDTSKPILPLIKELILKNFEQLHAKIEQLTLGEVNNKKLLRALAVGDRRIFSAFNRAGLNNGNGGAALNFLQEKGIIQIEYSREERAKSLNPHGKLKREVAKHRISHKVLFSQPFLRFWFYFVSPYSHEIQEGNYENFIKNFELKNNSYTSLVFEELSEVLLNYHLRDSQIISSGSYWDANIEIDILTITSDKKTYVAECKWTNHIVSKKEIHKLQQKCQKLDIEPDQIAFFSKRGFSKELENLQGKTLALYSSKDFSALVKPGSKNELIENFLMR